MVGSIEEDPVADPRPMGQAGSPPLAIGTRWEAEEETDGSFILAELLEEGELLVDPCAAAGVRDDTWAWRLEELCFGGDLDPGL